MIITLDDTLKPRSRTCRVGQAPELSDTFIHTVPGEPGYERHRPKGQNWDSSRVIPRDILRHDIPSNADAHHKGFFGYIDIAYNAHYGVVIDPTTVWFMVLSEFAGHIKGNPEHYRSLFTRSTGKEEIVIGGIGEEHINPQEFLPQLRERVPMGVDQFLPKFSTATQGYDIAAATAFCDAVSPFYQYSMQMCGIPRVQVLGTVEDWDRLVFHLGAVAGQLNLAWEYARKITPHIAKMRAAVTGEVDAAFWEKMYYTERCGSGSNVQVEGWLKDFAMTQPRLRYPVNYPTHIAKVEVKQLETGRKYAFCAGLLSSRIQDGFLVPSFNHLIERLPVTTAAQTQPERIQW